MVCRELQNETDMKINELEKRRAQQQHQHQDQQHPMEIYHPLDDATLQVAKEDMVKLQQLLRDIKIGLSEEEGSTDRTPYIPVATGIDNGDAPSVGMDSERDGKSENDNGSYETYTDDNMS